MYKTVKNSTPIYLNKMSVNINSVHSYNLRDPEFNIYILWPYTEAGKNSIHY